MSESTVLRDAEGNYYAFAPDQLAAARAADGTYEMAVEELEAARVPDDGLEAVEAALGLDEVSGFGIQPIPGVDIVIKKNPGGSAMFANLGGVAMMPPSGFGAGGSAAIR